MKVSRIQAEENRQTVINVASRLFREHGFNGIGLTDLMKAAGLTHGGFYKQFKSKDDLIAQACDRAMDESKGKWSSVVAKAANNPLADLVHFYLSPRHRNHIGNGCAFASLASDTGRGSPALRQKFETGIEEHLKILDGFFSNGTQAQARNESITTLATMVGALVLSRAVKDQAISERFLSVAAQAIVERHAQDGKEPPQAY